MLSFYGRVARFRLNLRTLAHDPLTRFSNSCFSLWSIRFIHTINTSCTVYASVTYMQKILTCRQISTHPISGAIRLILLSREKRILQFRVRHRRTFFDLWPCAKLHAMSECFAAIFALNTTFYKRHINLKIFPAIHGTELRIKQWNRRTP